MTKRELAESLFLKGYNCAQSAAGAFSDEVNLPLDVLLKIASPFGGGAGRLRKMCGALSGCFIVLGLLNGYSDPDDYEGKKELYKSVQKIALEFKSKNRSYICKELLNTKGESPPEPSVRDENFYKTRPCAKFIGDCAEILENFLKNA